MNIIGAHPHTLLNGRWRELCDNIEKSVRHLAIIILNCALLLSFLQAPASHVHSHEATQQHTADFFHSHVKLFEVTSSNSAEWRDHDPDDDAQFLTWFVTNLTEWEYTPAILRSSDLNLPFRNVSESRKRILRPSSHDPPSLDAIPPRAPPV